MLGRWRGASCTKLRIVIIAFLVLVNLTSSERLESSFLELDEASHQALSQRRVNKATELVDNAFLRARKSLAHAIRTQIFLVAPAERQPKGASLLEVGRKARKCRVLAKTGRCAVTDAYLHEIVSEFKSDSPETKIVEEVANKIRVCHHLAKEDECKAHQDCDYDVKDGACILALSEEATERYSDRIISAIFAHRHDLEEKCGWFAMAGSAECRLRNASSCASSSPACRKSEEMMLTKVPGVGPQCKLEMACIPEPVNCQVEAKNSFEETLEELRKHCAKEFADYEKEQHDAQKYCSIKEKAECKADDRCMWNFEDKQLACHPRYSIIMERAVPDACPLKTLLVHRNLTRCSEIDVELCQGGQDEVCEWQIRNECVPNKHGLSGQAASEELCGLKDSVRLDAWLDEVLSLDQGDQLDMKLLHKMLQSARDCESLIQETCAEPSMDDLEFADVPSASHHLSKRTGLHHHIDPDVPEEEDDDDYPEEVDDDEEVETSEEEVKQDVEKAAKLAEEGNASTNGTSPCTKPELAEETGQKEPEEETKERDTEKDEEKKKDGYTENDKASDPKDVAKDVENKKEQAPVAREVHKIAQKVVKRGDPEWQDSGPVER
mmetsp:Transcript_20455/g.36714  ORF Transcript_20455/g.36714 Transcript_20455/m.36714 type:complete len:609 (-) Transcript_20455:47-1873(-)